MKKIFHLITFFGFSIFLLNGCKEIAPPILLTPPKSGLIKDSAYTETSIPTADAKRVMMEEFSGQHCPNCPKGHIEIEQIKAANPNLVSAATIHTHAGVFGSQTDPIAPVDFRTTIGDDILSAYGAGAIGIPCAMVDRNLFSGQGSLCMLNASSWANYVTQELAKTSYVNIVLNSAWDALSSKATIAVELHFTSTTTDTLGVSLMITEDKIVAGQDSMGTILPNYVHNNIFRTMLTPTTGQKINHSTAKGSVVVYTFRTDVIDINQWNLNNLKLIAFVHQQNANSKNIIQVAEKSLQ